MSKGAASVSSTTARVNVSNPRKELSNILTVNKKIPNERNRSNPALTANKKSLAMEKGTEDTKIILEARLAQIKFINVKLQQELDIKEQQLKEKYTLKFQELITNSQNYFENEKRKMESEIQAIISKEIEYNVLIINQERSLGWYQRGLGSF